jgi:hypothetical protein
MKMIINIKQIEFRTYPLCVNGLDFGEERADGNGYESESELHDLRFSDGHKKLKGVELSVLIDVCGWRWR